MFSRKVDVNSVKDMFKKIYMLLLLGATLACTAAPRKPMVKVPGSTDITPDERQSVVVHLVSEMLQINYKKIPLDDSLSVVIYNRYLKSLDENHNYLLASDVKSFEQFKTKLDDDIKAGDLADVFYMFNVYQKRYLEHVKYSLAQLDKTYDFTKNETFTFDRDNLPYIGTQAEMDDLWSKRVKYDLLNLKLANPDMAKNKETLKKRYENLLSNANKLSNKDVFQQFMDAFTGAVDPHTSYFTPFNASQFNMEMSRSLEGIGATLATENDYVTIKTIVPGGPAYKTKEVNVDDRIVAVAQGKDGEFKDIVGWRIDDAISLIRGPKGTTVKLKLLPKGAKASDQPKEIDIVREKIVLEDRSAKSEIKTYNTNGKITRIGIINIPDFYMNFADYRAGNPNYKSVTRDVKRILDTLKQKGVDGVVIDLRENGGGSLPEAINLTGLFIKSGPVVQVRDSRNRVEVERDEDQGVAYSGPLAVMVDRFSASASEIFAGAIQDYGRGLIIGTQTYGKGTVQNEIDLDQQIEPGKMEELKALFAKTKTPVPDGSGNQSIFGQLNLTVAKFYRINGTSTQHKGVTPDIKFPSLIPMDKYGEDTEPSALPYDIIAKSNYVKAGDFSAVIPKLNQMFAERMANNPAYKYLVNAMNDYRKHDAEKSISLNEEQLKKQRDQDEAKTAEGENAERVALGLPVLKKGQKKPRNEDLDFLKYAGGQILTDYILMDNKLTKNTTVTPVPANKL
ncbi:carboxy terminal-processing peptidase [Mucilaginibacter sp. PPCGB 2223]|uniref:carboxy terminal-processing peptidase n=1 Tax=Mucilaginibacter sp. PPCGB 2223 TaxID=1886027 RepID=UPI0009F5A856|nr:carboxy terminal-processing peptidase [Mucilaginibacter sp. PPCGB 2223]